MQVDNLSSREAKLAKNQALFREVNEHISELDAGEPVYGGSHRTIGIVCECSKESCTALIDVQVDEYERVRESPARFLICRGHEFPKIERVVDMAERYEVVEKIGEAAEIVAELDPRSRV